MTSDRGWPDTGFKGKFKCLLKMESGENWEDRKIPNIITNPTPDEIAAIVSKSPSKTAKWLQVKTTGDRYFWPAEEAFHAKVADGLGLVRDDYTKGLAGPKN